MPDQRRRPPRWPSGCPTRDVPVLYLGDLLDRPEVKDLLCLLSLFADGDGSGPAARGRLARIRRAPGGRPGPAGAAARGADDTAGPAARAGAARRAAPAWAGTWPNWRRWRTTRPPCSGITCSAFRATCGTCTRASRSRSSKCRRAWRSTTCWAWPAGFDRRVVAPVGRGGGGKQGPRVPVPPAAADGVRRDPAPGRAARGGGA